MLNKLSELCGFGEDKISSYLIIAALSIGLSGVLGFVGLAGVDLYEKRKQERELSRNGKTIEARVGERMKIDNFRLLYKGMDDNNTKFLLGDIHYSVDVRDFSRDVLFDGWKRQTFKLNTVTPEKISITYLGKENLKY